MSLGFWNNLSPKGKRIITIALIFVAITITTGLALLTPVTHQQAVDTDNEINKTVQALQAHDSLLTGIFGNNFFLTMIMFIPFIGPVMGFIIFYNTGVVLESEAIALGYPPSLAFATLFLLPIIWLEFIAYSTAMAASIWLSARMFQGSFRHELINTAKFVALCAVILLVSAVIETAIISAT